MNLLTIAWLAHKNDKNLAVMVRRWTVNGRENPFPYISIAACALIFQAFLLVVVIALALLNSWWPNILGGKLSVTYSTGVLIAFLLPIPFLFSLSYMAQWWDFFLCMMQIQGIVGRGWWRKPHPWNEMGEKVTEYFKKKAYELEELQKIPWRESQAKRLREMLRHELKYLSSLALISSNLGDYFPSKGEKQAVTA